MSVVADVAVPTSSAAFQAALDGPPETFVEIERVVAHPDGTLTPYFWVHGDVETFESAVDEDESIEGTTRLDAYDESALYRADWPGRVATVAHAAVETGGTVIGATGRSSGWELQLRFEHAEELSSFSQYCGTEGVEFEVQRVRQLSESGQSGAFGVTSKQREALLVAHEAGFYEIPRDATTTTVADTLDISQQALSRRLRRGHGNLVEALLAAGTPPIDEPVLDSAQNDTDPSS